MFGGVVLHNNGCMLKKHNLRRHQSCQYRASFSPCNFHPATRKSNLQTAETIETIVRDFVSGVEPLGSLATEI